MKRKVRKRVRRIKRPAVKYQRLWESIDHRFADQPRIQHDLAESSTHANDDRIKDPHFRARQIVELHYTHNGILTLRYYRGQSFCWNGRCYRLVPKKELRARMNRDLRAILNGYGSSRAVNKSGIDNVLEALAGICLVPGHLEMPMWLDGESEQKHHNFLAMANGLLDLDKAIAGEVDVLHPMTPQWFCLAQWQYKYLQNAKCQRWLKFLKEVLPRVRERRLLQEFLGYCLVFDTSYHKFLVLVGEGANGKSVICTVATYLLGRENVTQVGLERFGDRFSLARTIGKLANIVSEVPGVRGVAEDKLKAIVSGDRIWVESKYQDSHEALPTVRLIFATNAIPEFADRSEGIWRRLLILPFEVTIPEAKQDRKLAEKICDAELPGIFNWTLAGLRRLRRQGGFTMPRSSKAILEEHKLMSNPARQFLVEECQASLNEEIFCHMLYDRYVTWCSLHNMRPLNSRQFGKEVRRVYPQVERKQLRVGKGKVRMYHYVGLWCRPPLGGLR